MRGANHGSIENNREPMVIVLINFDTKVIDPER